MKSHRPQLCLLLLVFLSLAGCSSDPGGAEPLNSVSPLNNPSLDNIASPGTNEGVVTIGDPGGEDGGVVTVGDPGGDDELIASPMDGKIELGPVVESYIEVFDVENMDSPLWSAFTSKSNDLATAGKFTIPENILRKDKLYLVQGTGGSDIDVDDDGILNEDDSDADGNGIEDLQEDEDGDGIKNEKDKDYSGGINGPFPVKGVTRLLITGEQMLNMDWKVSAISEYVFEALQYSEISNDAVNDILDTMNLIAPMLLDRDFNDDGKIDAFDLIVWQPDSFSENGTAFSPTQMRDFIRLIHKNKNKTQKTIPDYDRLLSHFDTRSSAERIIIENDIAYVLAQGTMLFIDVSNPKKPIQIGDRFIGPIRDFVVDEGKLFYTNERGLGVIDVKNPKHAVEINFFEIDVKRLQLSNGKLVLLTSSMTEDGSTKHYLSTMLTANNKMSFPIELRDNYTHMSVSDNRVYNWSEEFTNQGNVYIYEIGGEDELALVNHLSMSQLNPIDLDNEASKYWYQRYVFNKLQVYDNVESFTRYLGKPLDNWNQFLYTKSTIEIDKEPYGGQSIFTAHGDYLFVLSTQHTYTVYDITHSDEPKRLDVSLEICPEHTALRFTKDLIMTKCRDEFLFWDAVTFDFLGSKSVPAFNTTPGMLMDPSHGLNIIELLYHFAIFYLIEERIQTDLSVDVIPSVLGFLRNFDLIDVTQSYFNWRKWGVMMTYDFYLSGKNVYLATGDHGLQSLDFGDVKSKEKSNGAGSISIGKIEYDADKEIYVSNTDFIEDSRVSISPISDLNNESCVDATTVIQRNCLTDDKYYLVSSREGRNLDPDNNGKIDTPPVEIKGSLHGIFSAHEIMNGDWQVNLHSEYLYQKVKDRIEAGVDFGLISKDIALESDLIFDNLEGLTSLIEPIVNGDDSTVLSELVQMLSSPRTTFHKYSFKIKDIFASDNRLYLVDPDNYLYASDKKSHKILDKIKLPINVTKFYFIEGSLYGVNLPAFYLSSNEPIKPTHIIKIDIANDEFSLVSELLVDGIIRSIDGDDVMGVLAQTDSGYLQIKTPDQSNLELGKRFVLKDAALSQINTVVADSDLSVMLIKKFKPNVGADDQGDKARLIENPIFANLDEFSEEHIADLDAIKAWKNAGTSWAELDKTPFEKYGADISDSNTEFSVNDMVLASMLYHLKGYFQIDGLMPNTFRFSTFPTNYYLDRAFYNEIAIYSESNSVADLSRPTSIISNPDLLVSNIALFNKQLHVVGWSYEAEKYVIDVYDLQDVENPTLQTRHEEFKLNESLDDGSSSSFNGYIYFDKGIAYQERGFKLHAIGLDKDDPYELWHVEPLSKIQLFSGSMIITRMIGDRAYYGYEDTLIEVKLGQLNE